jgi:glycosyltransferase involved in cell wall biosynthesis
MARGEGGQELSPSEGGPLVSVVMGVFNAEASLEESLQSLLTQTGVDIEVIVVNDGSRDGCGRLLDNWAARDGRLRVFHQENLGLTAALRRGCSVARGRFIARHDADDVSLPGRLEAQARYLERHPEIPLVSCWTRFVGPEDEELFVVASREAPAEARRRLRAQEVASIKGIVHGSAMFRRAEYVRVGGYRDEFWLAQDLDLWLRLTDPEDAGVYVVPDILYITRFSPSSLSFSHTTEQVALAHIAVGLTRARHNGEDETALLAAAASHRRSPRTRRVGAGGFYFMARCLFDRRDRRARRYFRLAIREDPLHIKAWLGWAASALR